MPKSRRQSEGEKFAARLQQQEAQRLRPCALKCRDRKGELGDRFRAYPTENTPLEYRTEYQRDRDRIVWSRAFKRLQHKTQIFPAYSSDHFRRRLTHVLEVAQVATSIARALKLNVDATEAMALAHDIGHAPFGHAGEQALDETLANLDSPARYDTYGVLVYSFNHAVQGVETVERIEKEYTTADPPFQGLNLTFDVREGILKHCRFTKDPKLTVSTLDEVLGFRAYRQFGNDFGSLEAQCVLLADKLTYFFEDFEDALRSHTLKPGDVSRPLGELATQLGESALSERTRPIRFPCVDGIDSFLAFRRSGIAAFILDAIAATKKRIDELEVRTLEDAKRQSERVVAPTKEIEGARERVYDEYIATRTFRHELYQTTEHKAGRIVRDLFEEYYGDERLIPAEFRAHTRSAYGTWVRGREALGVLTARNYIAGMTDIFATARHKDLFMSGEQILIG